MLKVAVRTLAEFVHRRGDLHVRLDGRARAEEGIRLQRRLQQNRPGSYQRERAVSLVVSLADIPVTIAGRLDGCDLSTATVLVEEFKTTRADAVKAHQHHAAVHWAQARLYAGLLAAELEDGRGFELRLIYGHPDHELTHTFTETLSADHAGEFLQASLSRYGAWLAGQRLHEQARDASIRMLEFPYPRFRPFQRAVARRVFRALRAREHLLLEAPTGSGKTAATLFPAVRALEAAGYRRVLFLTSRNTGAIAAVDAARRMDPAQAYLRYITLTAREKACFLPGTPCEPESCRYARGYHDRVRGAVAALLERRAMGPGTVAEVARDHEVCPFELSLDTALWCDVVVADYNYVFDPLVRLQRLSADPDTVLLVDECHQLTPRARDMLSLTVSRSHVKGALAEALPEALARRVRALDRALTTLRRRHGLREEQIIERPEPLLRAMQRFAGELTTGEQSLDSLPATRELLFICSRWGRSETWYDPQRFLFTGCAERRDVEVRLVCIDPGPYLKQRLDEYGGHVRFSGTVSPLTLYARLHGEDQGAVERAGNPYRADQLKVLVVDNVPTYLQSRKSSLDQLLDVLSAVVSARSGHYLAAFPSFEYLGLAAAAFAARYPHVKVAVQTPAMDETARTGFLAKFAAGAAPLLGFVVLGGAFGESVDFSAARLAGVVCVGVGLPPPSLARRALEKHFEALGVDGRAVAFQQPAMVKVLQMAGRLLRGPCDRGVLCLVDPRFREAAYRRFFPDHWHPQPVRSTSVASELAEFWQDGHTVPRLRGSDQEIP